MSSFTAVYDACVLYPSSLRSFLMYLALTDLFRARWSNEIHEEWMRHVEDDHENITRKQVERIRDLMNEHVRDCLVTGYEDLIDAIELPDPGDRHVVAAAIRCGASVIVSKNLKDFPADALNQYGIEAQHPDVFISHLFDLSESLVCQAAHHHRASLKNPKKTVGEYLDSLEAHGLASTVASLREYEALL